MAVTRDIVNKYLLEKMAIHPFSTFDEASFLNLLEHSLSLTVPEKKRVIDAIPTLMQKQIDELTKVFTDEREEFKKLMDKPEEKKTIIDLVEKQKQGWLELYEKYQQEAQMQEEQMKHKEAQADDQAKIDNIKKNLGL